MSRNVLVTGAGGFIGGYLATRLVDEGNVVVGADVKPRDEWKHVHADVLVYDRCDVGNLDQLALLNSLGGPFDEVYNLAAEVGGVGYIENVKVPCMLSVLTTTNVLRAAEAHGWSRVFYPSSACVYPYYRQDQSNVTALRECDAYPADPSDGYGWEKLFGERMHRHFMEERGIETRVARYHNTYGPRETWFGGREKAPAATCRKVAEAVVTGEKRIHIWGDGEQARSFTHVDDTVEGTLRLMRSDVREPLNIGSSELVTINQLVTLVENAANVELERTYDLDAPKGVRGRNSDNTLIRKYLDWEPTTSLIEGIIPTYEWIYERVVERRRMNARD